MKNVTYLGSVPYAEIHEQIAKAAVCVFPSFAEALPVSWLEAMAMQKAVIASNVGWASEIIQDGVEGFLVHPTNHVEYANKISVLLNNTELQRKFGIAVGSGTDALYFALRAKGIGPGSTVLCPAISYLASAEAIKRTGAVIQFVDVDENEHRWAKNPDEVEVHGMASHSTPSKYKSEFKG